MTMFLCQCGEAHDSAVQGPCPVTITFPIDPVAPGTIESGFGHTSSFRRLIMLDAVDRCYIASALRARHEKPSRYVTSLIAKMAETTEERKFTLDWVKAKAEELRRPGDGTSTP